MLLSHIFLSFVNSDKSHIFTPETFSFQRDMKTASSLLLVSSVVGKSKDVKLAPVVL